jgi:hypothetical protein
MRQQICAIAFSCVVVPFALAQPRLDALPAVPSGNNGVSLSVDGRLVTVVLPATGGAGLDITRWTPEGTTLTAGVFAASGALQPSAVSRNGQFIAGRTGGAGASQIFIAGPGGISITGPATDHTVYPQSISESGMFVAGGAYRQMGPGTLSSTFRLSVAANGGTGAFTFAAETATPYGSRTARHGVSENGVVTGVMRTSLAGHGFTYRFDDVGYSILRSGLISDTVWVAANGSSIIDTLEFGSISRWTVVGGVNVPQPMGFVGSDYITASPNAQVFAATYIGAPNIWRPTGPAGAWQNTTLTAWLTGAGLDTTGWSFSRIYELTDDASTIIGDGTYNGAPATFVAYNVPSPSAIAPLTLLGLFTVRRRSKP